MGLTNFSQVKQNPAFARLKSVESGFVGSQGFDSRDDLVSLERSVHRIAY